MSEAMDLQTKVWCDTVYDTLIGKTKGTFDAINANQNTVKVEKPDAISLLGFMVNYIVAKHTDAENVPDLRLQVTNKALGISEEELMIGHGGCDANATNSWEPFKTEYVPFGTDKPEKLFNSEFKFKAAPSVTNTEGLDVFVGVVYANKEPDLQFQIELMSQMHKRAFGGVSDSDAAKAHAAATFSTDTSLTIPTGPQEMIGHMVKVNPNGISAEDPISGMYELIASGIPDFSPQVWPLPTFWQGVLGTTVNENAQSGLGRYYPTRFPLTGTLVTVGVKTLLAIAAATAPDVSQAIIYR